MSLNPADPPGHLNRKALRYAREIVRLRREGYTCEAIRRALFDAGLRVSLSTVKREAARRLMSAQTLRLEHGSEFAAAVSPPAISVPALSSAAFAGDPRSGKDIAAAWMKDRITNPLLRSRITVESSGH